MPVSVHEIYFCCLDYINPTVHCRKQGTRYCRPIEERVYLYSLSLQYAIIEHSESEVLHEFSSAKIYVSGFDFILLLLNYLHLQWQRRR